MFCTIFHAAECLRSKECAVRVSWQPLLTSERAYSISHAREGCFVLLAITTTVSLELSRPARSIDRNETVEEDFSQLSRNVGVQLKETNAWLKEFYSPGQFPELCQYINWDPSIIGYNTGSSTLECWRSKDGKRQQWHNNCNSMNAARDF